MQEPTTNPTQEIHSSDEETAPPNKKKPRTDENQNRDEPDEPQQARGSQDPPAQITPQTGEHTEQQARG
eukprot:12924213-Prorocentrum_lima.AAC.1